MGCLEMPRNVSQGNAIFMHACEVAKDFAAVLLPPLGMTSTCCRLVCTSTPNQSVTGHVVTGKNMCNGMQVHARAGRATRPCQAATGQALQRTLAAPGVPAGAAITTQRQCRAATRSFWPRRWAPWRAVVRLGLGQQHPQPHLRVRYRGWT